MVTVSLKIEALTTVTFKLTIEELLLRVRGFYRQTFQINWVENLQPKTRSAQPTYQVNIYEVLPIGQIRVLSNEVELEPSKLSILVLLPLLFITQNGSFRYGCIGSVPAPLSLYRHPPLPHFCQSSLIRS